MRKIIVLNRVSLDGFFAGPNGEIDWFVQDPEIDTASHEMMHPDTILFGRVTYQQFESFWPQVARDPKSSPGFRKLADELNQMTKVVFSTTLKEVTWENSTLLKGSLIEEVRTLKQGKGPDITMFGSGTLVQQLTNEGLIDDYLMIVTPVVLGTGKPLFKEVKRSPLELVEARNFHSGNVLLHYRTHP